MCLGSIGRVVRTWDAGGIPMGRVHIPGRDMDACLMYHPAVAVGDDVVVHMGFVVEVLDGQTATDARALRTEISERVTG
jgi:hydrogenase maturation factor